MADTLIQPGSIIISNNDERYVVLEVHGDETYTVGDYNGNVKKIHSDNIYDSEPRIEDYPQVGQGHAAFIRHEGNWISGLILPLDETPVSANFMPAPGKYKGIPRILQNRAKERIYVLPQIEVAPPAVPPSPRPSATAPAPAPPVPTFGDSSDASVPSGRPSATASEPVLPEGPPPPTAAVPVRPPPRPSATGSMPEPSRVVDSFVEDAIASESKEDAYDSASLGPVVRAREDYLRRTTDFNKHAKPGRYVVNQIDSDEDWTAVHCSYDLSSPLLFSYVVSPDCEVKRGDTVEVTNDRIEIDILDEKIATVNDVEYSLVRPKGDYCEVVVEYKYIGPEITI